jgi:hypothetical protein
MKIIAKLTIPVAREMKKALGRRIAMRLSLEGEFM